MTAPRSRSVPASREISQTPSGVEELAAPFPTLSQESTGDQRVPSWIQELANARVGRQSRASSVVSTRTRFSTTTFDDARSIDIQAGGRTYTISRFGDRVTDTSAPPPYPGPDDEPIFAHQPDNFHVQDREDALEHRHQQTFHRGSFRGRARRHPRRVRIATPDHEGTAGNEDESIMVDTPSRELTDEELRQIILDLPARLKSVLGINSERREGSIQSDAEGSDIGSTMSRSDRASGLDPSAREFVPDPVHEDGLATTGQVRGILRNAPIRAPYHTDAALLGRGERRWWPPGGWARPRGWAPSSGEHVAFASHHERHVGTSSLNSQSNAGDEKQEDNDVHDLSEIVIPRRLFPGEGTDSPPTVGDLNELSQVYNKVIRDIDREHRKQLHDRDKELDQLRILLHEKDIVYRQQLKGKDFIIEDTKQRLDRLEETMERSVELARNEVEDMWESRWKEHQKQLLEKCGLIRPALHSYMESASQTDE